jgi:hypothetical protein
MLDCTNKAASLRAPPENLTKPSVGDFRLGISATVLDHASERAFQIVMERGDIVIRGFGPIRRSEWFVYRYP